MSKAIGRLYARRRFGIELGLEREMALLNALGNPERGLKIIHVAGTNGKGSTCALIESVLRAAGLRTGLYTSPHLIRLNERFRVDGQPITDDELSALLWRVEVAAEGLESLFSHGATFFECTTAMALACFRDARADVVVLETGLGGRLDATNVVAPVACAITSIGHDHGQYLGESIREIAREKAGIVKAGCPVVCGEMPREARDVIADTARERAAPFISVADVVSVTRHAEDLSGQVVSVSTESCTYGRMRLALLGRHQLENLGIAAATVEAASAGAGIEVSRGDLRKGIEAAKWSGRLQVVSTAPLVIVDGAHNVEAGVALKKALKSLSRSARWGVVLGMCRDKDVPGFIRTVAGAARRLWLVPLSVDRGMAPDELAGAAAAVGVEGRAEKLSIAFEEAKDWASGGDRGVCVTGSLFLAGEFLEMLGVDV